MQQDLANNINMINEQTIQAVNVETRTNSSKCYKTFNFCN